MRRREKKNRKQDQAIKLITLLTALVNLVTALMNIISRWNE